MTRQEWIKYNKVFRWVIGIGMTIVILFIIVMNILQKCGVVE